VSEQNVALLGRRVDAYNARDIEAFIAHCDPDIQFHAAWSAAGPTVYHGHDGLRSWHRELEDAWEEIRAEPEAFFDLGDKTLMFAVLHGRGRRSGAEATMPNVVVGTWRDGFLVHLKAYLQKEDALKDLSLSEDALELIAP
jgi:ketosteroid isomerase-like protein